MTDSTYKLLKKIERRPALWTGKGTLESINVFLQGYKTAVNDYKVEDDFGLPIEFFEFVAHKFGFYETTAGWANMILAVTIGLDPKNIRWEGYDSNVTSRQHQESVVIFYELIEEYINR